MNLLYLNDCNIMNLQPFQPFQPLEKVEPNTNPNPKLFMEKVEPTIISLLRTIVPMPNQETRNIEAKPILFQKMEQMKNATEFQKYCQIEFQKNIQKITETARKKRDSPEEKMKKLVKDFLEQEKRAG